MQGINDAPDADTAVIPALANIIVVLVATTHPGNIGAAARAMKTMGLNRLRLVTPYRFPAVEATARASGADDILEQAQIHSCLADALADCIRVVGTTARPRSLEWPVRDPRSSAVETVACARTGQVALVFGREHAGLTNAEVELCHQLVRIPTAANFSSLNVASAVQILAYELRLAGLLEKSQAESPEREAPLATQVDMERFYDHMEQAMTDVGFFNPQKPKRLLRRLRRLFNRSALDTVEVNLLRGFFSAAQAPRNRAAAPQQSVNQNDASVPVRR